MQHRFVGVLAVVAVISVAGCGDKVDRAGSKKLITASLTKGGASAEETKCVTKLLDGYSDKELVALDKEFKTSIAPTSDLAKKFQADAADCTKSTNVKTLVDQLKKARPTLTAAEEKCATDLLMAVPGAEMSSSWAPALRARSDSSDNPTWVPSSWCVGRTEPSS